MSSPAFEQNAQQKAKLCVPSIHQTQDAAERPQRESHNQTKMMKELFPPDW